jgi:hypothetical protein
LSVDVTGAAVGSLMISFAHTANVRVMTPAMQPKTIFINFISASKSCPDHIPARVAEQQCAADDDRHQ